MDRIGLLLPGEPSIPRMTELARRAESLGYESVWFAETRFTRDAIVAAAAAAAATTRVRIGTAVVNPFTRGAVLTAMTFASLDELSGGRVILGIGPGSPNVLAKQGISWQQPLGQLREHVQVIRSLIAGETVAFEGRTIAARGARLDFSPIRTNIPIFFGVTGPRALELAGELADGVILNGLVPTDYVPWSAHHVQLGAARAGRDAGAIETAAILTTSVDPDDASARDALRPLIAGYLSGFPQLARATSLSPKYIDSVASANEKSASAATQLISDDVVALLACAGTPEDCRRIVASRRAAGVQVPLISVAAGDLELAVTALAPNRGA